MPVNSVSGLGLGRIDQQESQGLDGLASLSVGEIGALRESVQIVRYLIGVQRR